MQGPTIEIAGEQNKDDVLNTLMLAFAADPVMRWFMPSASDFAQHFKTLCKALGGRAFEAETAFVASDHSAAALWLPPGVAADEDETAETFLAVLRPEILEDLLKMGEALNAFHPVEPHWYLSFLGVDPASQGQGRGALMLKHTLRRCDEDRTPAYLESSNPRNISLYERHGFEVMGEIMVGNLVPLTPMIRAPR